MLSRDAQRDAQGHSCWERGLCTPGLLAQPHPGQREDRQTLTGNKLIKHLSPHLRLPQHYKAHFLPEAFLSRFLLPGP